MSEESNFSPNNEIDWSCELEDGSQSEAEKQEDDSTQPMENKAVSEQSGELNPKKRGLGRGLDALFGDDDPHDDDKAVSEDSAPGDNNDREAVRSASVDIDEQTGLQRKNVNIDQLEPHPDQPRRQFDDSSLDELAQSIARHGVLQPILVRPKFDGSNQYEIIAGERRWRACQKVNQHTVPVIIHDLGDEATLEIALIENLQREDLNAMDEALGYRRMIDEFDNTQESLAEMLGKSRSHIANILRLTNLPDTVQDFVRQGKLSSGHARTLVKAKDPQAIAHKIMKDGLSVRQAEKLAKNALDTKQSTAQKQSSVHKASKQPKDQDTRVLEEELSNNLGVGVDISMVDDGGRLTLTFDNLDQLDDLLHRLTHGAPKHGNSI